MNHGEHEDEFVRDEGDVEISSGASGNESEAEVLFFRALDWLRDHYAEFVFYVERDIVWTIQKKLNELIATEHLPFRVFNDYPMLSGAPPQRRADLAILKDDDQVLLAVEFKYEPSHARNDIPKTKLPVVFWGMDGVAKDIDRIGKFVTECTAEIALSIFIDEGGAFRHRPAHPGSKWIDWNGGERGFRPSLLRARAYAAEASG